jgi:hypothetical protein
VQTDGDIDGLAGGNLIEQVGDDGHENFPESVSGIL